MRACSSFVYNMRNIALIRDGEICEFDKGAKIVMASSLGNNKNLKAALEAGAIDFIQKPVDETRLQEILDKNRGGR